MKGLMITLFTLTTIVAQNSTFTTQPVPTQASGVCKLQFTSPCTQNSECGDLNGFNLTCLTSGSNKQCSCLGNAKNCQKQSTSADFAYQFDECSTIRPCVSGNGFTALDGNSPPKTCGEPLYCVREQNPNAAATLKSICHTCGSCQTQNVKNAEDPNETRFDCSKICPPPKTTTISPGATLDPSTTEVTTRPSKATTQPIQEPVASTAAGIALSIAALTIVLMN